jgi:hypothetical protein
VTYRPPRKTAGVDPASWAFGARKVGGQPLDHRRQPYLLEPLYESALAMEQGQTGLTLGVLKGRQTGFTTGGMTLLLWHLDEHGGMSLHAVPTQKNAERFNSTILVPTLDDTTFRHIAPGTIWNQDVKAFKGDHSASYVLGHTLGGNQTAEGDGFRGLTAQVCLFDERGTMPEAACSVIESCLDVCATPIIWNVGSAGFRGDALDRFFRSGTRAEWVIPCQSCAKHTILVRYGDEVEAIGRCLGHDGYRWFYACEHCGREIDPGLGEWEHQTGMHRSYHVSSLNSCFFTAAKLKARLDNPNTTEESLMREVGGLPFGGEGLTVEPQDIKVVDRPSQSAHFCVQSVDWGSRSSWLVLKADKDRVYVCETGTVDGKHDAHVPQLHTVAKRFNPDYIACDQGYEGGRNEKMSDLTGVAWGVISNLAPRPGNVLEQVQRDRRSHVYRIVRPWVWERLVEAIRKGDQPGGVVFLPGLEPLRDDILAVTPEKAGRGTREWVTYDMTAQHFAACLLYAYAVVLRERGRKAHSSVGAGNPMGF